MTAYVAGSMHGIEEVRRRVADLEQRCFRVLSTWHARDESGETMREIATIDLIELVRSQEVIVNADTPSSTGGYFVEAGAALALGKPVTVIGDGANVFFHLPGVQRFETWSEYLTHLDSSAVAAHVANPGSFSRGAADEQHPLTESEIKALAADGTRFENEFGCHIRGPMVHDGDEQ